MIRPSWAIVPMGIFLSMPACLQAGQLAAAQVQAAVENASGMMDGTAKSPGLASNAAGWQAAELAAVETAIEEVKAGFAGEQKDLAARSRLDQTSVPAAAGETTKEDKQGGPLRGVYKWMVRNPVEVSFMVAIPVTLIAGFTAGSVAGFAVYFFLQSRQKKPF